MLKTLVLTFAIFSFFSSSFMELEESLHEVSNTEQSITKEVQTATIYETHTCADTECSDEEHCLHFCVGLHNLTKVSQKISLKGPMVSRSSISWIFNNHYNMPSLDPGLRPPIHS